MYGTNGSGTNGKHTVLAPVISVITACHNTERYIAQCVRSVRDTVTCGQFRIEHICCDDGSTDATTSILRSLADTHAHTVPPVAGTDYLGLRVISLRQNSGKPSHVRNEAIKQANGKYIFCLDDDDILIQNSLRYLVRHLLTHPAARWVYGDFLRVGKDLQYLGGQDYYGWPHSTPQDLLYSVFKGDHFYQHSLLFERSLFQAVGGYDPDIRMGEDLDLCARFVMAGCMPTHLPVNTHLHRDHGGNMTAHFGWEEHMADVRDHYIKHKYSLTHWLTSDQITEIETSLGLVPSGAKTAIVSVA